MRYFIRFLPIIAAVLASVTATAAVLSAPAADGAVRGTQIFSVRGKLLGEILSIGGGGFEYPPGGSGECWIGTTRRGWSAGITHSDVGGSVRVGRNRWNMWARKTFRGFAIRRSSTRWNIYSAKARFIAYTRGPDGGAAATGYLVLGRCS